MSRMCPRCEIELAARTSQAIEVDVCPRCRGVYFDPREFDRLVAERFEQKRLESTFAFIAAPTDDALPCPACSHPMDRVDHDGLEFDRCGECEGLWLDRDELSAIAENARERDANLPRDWVACAGCGEQVAQRYCIRRMDDWWCEQCVIDGNHPGPEAQLVGMREQTVAAALAFADANAAQNARRQRQARLKKLSDRETRLGDAFRPRARLGAVGAAIVAFLEDLLTPR